MTTTATTAAPDTLETLGATWLETFRIAYDPEVQQSQWELGMTPTPRDDTTQRSKGTTSDPTFAIFADSRRQDLRAAVQRAEFELDEANKIMAQTRDKLRVAFYSYDGRLY
ncbi:hypothetical protein E3T24_04755 [Cryobacterium sp. TmT2-59]|uniref:DUF7169 domain-containing protein n=1 Tax=Cryobacterium sp. TmT2-59 TaxID=1259264 RepID=UPI00106DB905|nr:hypothetical protein [Cryobacterium sp. TmT2-59]TFC87505.1 hypothetical protein E3T24_04755 [Cryobacterium sp. TmT2-59]